MTDILDTLKVKEGELEALIEKAHAKATAQKEEARKKAIEFRVTREDELMAELSELEGTRMREMEEELHAIDSGSLSDVKALRAKAEGRMDDAVRVVKRLILEDQ